MLFQRNNHLFLLASLDNFIKKINSYLLRFSFNYTRIKKKRMYQKETKHALSLTCMTREIPSLIKKKIYIGLHVVFLVVVKIRSCDQNKLLR